MQNLSALGYVWSEQEFDEKLTKKIIQEHNLNDLIAKILVKKGIDFDKINEFLYPKIKNIMPSPFHLIDMKKGVEHIIPKIKDRKKINK